MGFENEHISYEELLELVNQLSLEDKQKLIRDITISEVEKAILEDFKKYEETFRALA
jgi:DNA polymerase sigma